jgi:alkylresorcinol/alkylpyrone synthase
LTLDDIGSWVSHPGGPRVLESINTALGLDDDALELSWRSLGEIGNVSSASVLHILRDARAKPPATGTPGLLMAMGPGFCAELVLLRWH